MNIFSLTVPIYDWAVTIFTDISNEPDYQAVTSHCNKYGVPDDIVNSLLSNLVGKCNGGSHLCCHEIKTAFIFFNPINNEVDFWNIYPHEINHLVDNISKCHSLDSESASYLTGFIHKSLFQLGVVDDIKANFLTVAESNENIGTHASDEFYKLLGFNDRKEAELNISQAGMLTISKLPDHIKNILIVSLTDDNLIEGATEVSKDTIKLDDDLMVKYNQAVYVLYIGKLTESYGINGSYIVVKDAIKGFDLLKS